MLTCLLTRRIAVHLTCACRSCRSCSLPTAIIKDVGKKRPERAELLRRRHGGGVGAGRRHCQSACSSCYSAAEAQPLAARMRASQHASCQKSPRINTTCQKEAHTAYVHIPGTRRASVSRAPTASWHTGALARRRSNTVTGPGKSALSSPSGSPSVWQYLAKIKTKRKI